MSVRYETRDPLPAAARHRMIEQLNLVMADILDNHYQSLLAHWNTRGANFTELHKLFKEYAGSNGAENWCHRVGRCVRPTRWHGRDHDPPHRRQDVAR